ncbi:unnamed protein product [Coregonus sp. 'balchen']|nr:unnamed protein product [Coregonus sp. 'balchen']
MACFISDSRMSFLALTTSTTAHSCWSVSTQPLVKDRRGVAWRVYKASQSGKVVGGTSRAPPERLHNLCSLTTKLPPSLGKRRRRAPLHLISPGSDLILIFRTQMEGYSNGLRQGAAEPPPSQNPPWPRSLTPSTPHNKTARPFGGCRGEDRDCPIARSPHSAFIPSASSAFTPAGLTRTPPPSSPPPPFPLSSCSSPPSLPAAPQPSVYNTPFNLYSNENACEVAMGQRRGLTESQGGAMQSNGVPRKPILETDIEFYHVPSHGDASKKRLMEDTEDWRPRSGTTQSRSFRILAQITGTEHRDTTTPTTNTTTNNTTTNTTTTNTTTNTTTKTNTTTNSTTTNLTTTTNTTPPPPTPPPTPPPPTNTTTNTTNTTTNNTTTTTNTTNTTNTTTNNTTTNTTTTNTTTNTTNNITTNTTTPTPHQHHHQHYQHHHQHHHQHHQQHHHQHHHHQHSCSTLYTLLHILL